MSLGQENVTPSDSSQSAAVSFTSGVLFFFFIYYQLNCFLRKISRRLLATSFQYRASAEVMLERYRRVGKHEGIQSSAVGLPLSQDQEGGLGRAPHLSKAFSTQKISLGHCCSFSLTCIVRLGKGAGTKGIC